MSAAQAAADIAAGRINHADARDRGGDVVLRGKSTFIFRWIRRRVSFKGRPGAGGLFGDINDLKRTSEDLGEKEEPEPKYNDRLCGRIAASKPFEYVTIGVIVLNALCIGWDTDYTARFGKDDNLYKGPVYFAVIECFFCAYFSTEMVIRFVGYRIKWHCLFDAWFVFDSLLVTMMLLETLILPFLSSGGGVSQLSILRLLRLLRVTRMAKLMRAFPQLMMIVHGIAAAAKAVFWTGLLLIIVTYTWAILFTNEYHQGFEPDATVREWAEEADLDEPKKYGMDFFGSMGKSMLSLLVMGTILDDVTACCDAIRKSKNVWMLGAFIMYILLNSFTMMNMLVGILVEVVGSTAEGEKNRLVEEGVREAIMTIFEKMDKDGSGCISLEEFQKMRSDSNVMKALQELDVKEKQFDMYVQLLFQPDEKGQTPNLTFKELLDCICRLRPGTAVCALDFASFKHCILKGHGNIRSRVGRIEQVCNALLSSCGPQPPPPPLPAVEPPPDMPTRRRSSSDAGAQGNNIIVISPPSWQSDIVTAQPGGEAARATPRRINMSMLAELERASTADIVTELQRRLGVPNLEESGVPWNMMDEELQGRLKASEAFHTLGVPQHDPEWSGEVLTC
mmetsp:Transcript_110899/g.313707  ORF Transcript_110899/g.313707 Transcript_110899/m.313707 type:complete len:620 (-) Transcript_110899:81-1940(-)